MNEVRDLTVRSWLESIGLSQYMDSFEANRITVEMLPSLRDSDLKECGVIALGDRKKILLAIKELRSAGSRFKAGASRRIAAPTTPTSFAEFSPPSFQPAAPVVPRPSKPIIGAPALQVSSADSPMDTGEAPKEKSKWRPWRRFGGTFLFVSIVVHILFGIGATYLVVQTIQAKRKLTFQAGPKSPNPVQRAIEHKVSMAKKQSTMSAPAQPKRITTTGTSRVALPDMPAMPKMDDFTPGQMAGVGGVGVGAMIGGIAGASGGTAGAGLTLFGFRDAKGGGLAGTFYDLKQTKGRRPTGMTPEKYSEEILKFTEGGWNESAFSQFFKSPKQLYAQQILLPHMDASEGPKAFDLADKVQPKMWIVHYKATLIPPDSGRYRFVGKGDDVMIVRFDGNVVLDYGQPDAGKLSSWKSSSKPIMYPNVGAIGMMPGTWFEVSVVRKYPIEILIGERPGGAFYADLLIEQQGASYKKVSGNPILPLFRTSAANPLKNDPQTMPPFDPSGPVWKTVR
jgi:hypothetical protein